MLAEERDQFLLTTPHNSIIVSLVYAGLHKALFLAYVDELLHFDRGVIREPEILKLALPESLVHRFGHVLEGRLAVRHVQEHGLDRGGPKIGERLADTCFELGGLVGAGRPVKDFGVNGEA